MANYSNPKKGIFRNPKWDNCGIEKTKEIPSHGITEPKFTKLGYDGCAYKLDVMESMAPGMYHLNDRTHYDSCFMQFPGYLAHNEDVGILPSAVDTESELRRLNYVNSKCPEARYNPMKNCKACEKCNSGIPCGCQHCKKDPHNYTKRDCVPQLVPEFTRDRKPCNDLTSLNINRFEPLCLDLQRSNRIQSNDYIGQQTRYNMKDLTRQMRKKLPKPEFKDHCDCGKVVGIHSSLKCLYEKDVKTQKILPTNWGF